MTRGRLIFFLLGVLFLLVMERCDFPIGPNNARVFLLYSCYWHFCKYSEKYEPEHIAEQQKYFFERLIEI